MGTEMIGAEEITIPASYISNLLRQVEQSGYDPEKLFADLTISREQLTSERYCSAPLYGKLYQRAMLAMQDEWFGMLSGGKIRSGSFRMLCLLMVQCKNLRQALMRAWEFGRICRGFKISQKLEVEGDVARIRLAPLEGVSEAEFRALLQQAEPVKVRTTLAASQHHWSWLIGSEIKIIRTCYDFPKPDQDWEMAQINVDTEEFDQPFSGFEFPAKYLDYSIIQTEETMENFIRTAPFGLLINLDSGNSTKARVKSILNQNVGRTMLGAERVADRLNMSVTTLRRHLQIEGTSFQRLKDECRMEAAFHYLACPDFSNRDIADRLGFDELSVFFRAFKKWTGVTPGQYRASLTGAPATDN
ncbi:AraC family transcriptional regulator [Pseudomaricurvus sp. HS19]|uniref:AraC family transcriptional regulator n=1 Tax=Pseudomaricurvus sp. HS19 TaxID=2692626 RepID=UPI001F490A21|nr:AraC family transcriptional regulator [Pseudomaricurvus sp. HS19]